jgi:ribosomal protein S18 acetylase RimI-like enzyme
MDTSIRDFHLADLPHVYDICRLTGNSGKDSTGLYSDNYILGQYYAAPYPIRDPRCCFILARGELPVGYVLGTRDTAGFTKWALSSWLPALRARYPLSSQPGLSPEEIGIRKTIHADPPLPEFIDSYPAHLHIDILPEGQGSGWGKKLMDSFMDRLIQLECPGVHLGVSKKNERAIGFYSRYGMTRLWEDEGTVVYAMKLR